MEQHVPFENDNPNLLSQHRLLGTSTTIDEAITMALMHRESGNHLLEIQIYDQALLLEPDSVSLHKLLGKAYDNSANYLEAVRAYGVAIGLQPEAATYINRGVALHNLERYKDAIADFECAISLNCSEPLAHYNLGNTVYALQRFDDALTNYNLSIDLMPDHAKSHCNRGAALRALGRHAEALDSYNRAVDLSPDNPAYYLNQADALCQLGRFKLAIEACERAIALDADISMSYYLLGIAYAQISLYEHALVNYHRALSLDQSFSLIYYELGKVSQALGLYAEALSYYDKTLAINSDLGCTYFAKWNLLLGLGNISEADAFLRDAMSKKALPQIFLGGVTHGYKYSSSEHDDARQIYRLLEDNNESLDLHDRAVLYNALAKIYDDCGQYDEAFNFYLQANNLRNTLVEAYDPKQTEASVHNLMAVFDPHFFARNKDFGSDITDPIFIVGMPRSGTTLLTSILSNHPSISSAGELSSIINITSQISEASSSTYHYPMALVDLDQSTARIFINKYMAALKLSKSKHSTYIIDKHPLNFWHLGFISLLFPRARILHCCRNPLDTCLSIYFQSFSEWHNYAFHLDNIAHYYLHYVNIMQWWNRILPSEFMDVEYEHLVQNPEKSICNILAFLKLEWNDSCLQHTLNPHHINTASSWQVRQPIYKTSVGRWQNYDKHIGLLRKNLEPLMGGIHDSP